MGFVVMPFLVAMSLIVMRLTPSTAATADRVISPFSLMAFVSPFVSLVGAFVVSTVEMYYRVGRESTFNANESLEIAESRSPHLP